MAVSPVAATEVGPVSYLTKIERQGGMQAGRQSRQAVREGGGMVWVPAILQGLSEGLFDWSGCLVVLTTHCWLQSLLM